MPIRPPQWGDVKPNIIDDKIIIGAMRARIPCFALDFISPNDALGVRGKSNFRAAMRLKIINDNPTNTPGITPAKNNRPTDSSAKNPYTTKAIDGGIIGPINPDANVTAAGIIWRVSLFTHGFYFHCSQSGHIGSGRPRNPGKYHR